MTRRLLALATAAALAAAPRPAPAAADECAAPGADWIFCSGFEEGDLAVWDDYDGNPAPANVVLEDPGPGGRPGNHVMRLRVPPGRGGADLVKVLPGGHDRVYARWYARWEPGYDFDAPSHGSGLHAGDRNLLANSGFRPDGSDRFSALVDVATGTHRPSLYAYYRGMYQDCADPVGGCWGDRFPCLLDEGARYCTRPAHRETVPPPVLETGRWYCVEIMLDGGTPTADGDGADGTFDLWIDGVEYGPWDDLWLRTTPDLQPAVLWLSLFHHGEHSVEGLYLDDVVVSTSPIGPRGAGTPEASLGWGALRTRYR